MLFSVNTNNNSLAAQKNLMRTNVGLNKSVQKLSSGSRINSSSDDAAGLSIAENLKNKAREAQTGRNSNNGISIVPAATGAAANAALFLAPTTAERMANLVVQPALTSDLANRAVEAVRAGIVQDPTATLRAQSDQSPERATILLR